MMQSHTIFVKAASLAVCSQNLRKHALQSLPILQIYKTYNNFTLSKSEKNQIGTSTILVHILTIRLKILSYEEMKVFGASYYMFEHM